MEQATYHGFTKHCTLYTVHCTLYTGCAHSALHLYSVHWMGTLSTASEHSTLDIHTTYCIGNLIHWMCNLYIRYAHCTLHLYSLTYTELHCTALHCTVQFICKISIGCVHCTVYTLPWMGTLYTLCERCTLDLHTIVRLYRVERLLYQ